MSQKSEKVTDQVVSDDIDLPEVTDGIDAKTLSFNKSKGHDVEVNVEVTEDENHPMDKWISHRHNITDEIRKKIDDIHEQFDDQTYKSYQAREFWKREYTGAIHITENDLEMALNSKLHTGKYKDLSIRSVLSHDSQYIRWMCERQLFRCPTSLLWRIVDLLLKPQFRCRFHNSQILKELSEYKKEQKRKFQSQYEGKYKKYKKY